VTRKKGLRVIEKERPQGDRKRRPQGDRRERPFGLSPSGLRLRVT